jgi:hypothetical protein
MSISSMTNVALARRTDIESTEPLPSSASGIVEATAGTPETRAGVGGALQVIMTYIPTEILALYTSIATAIQTTEGPPIEMTAWIAFVVCLILAPLSVWLLYAGKVKLSGKDVPVRWAEWPVWEMFAATIAFFAWGFSMPNSPFRFFEEFYSPAIAAIVLPCSALVLGLLAPILQRPLKA